MNRSVGIGLRVGIVLVGAGALAFLLWVPLVDGANANATLVKIYFQDPFVAYVYASSLLFFTALYQAYRCVGYVERDRSGGPQAARALRIIKRCALALAGCVLAAMIYLRITVDGKDDIAGGQAMGMMALMICGAMAAAATGADRRLRRMSQAG